jgi:hypothetical protein
MSKKDDVEGAENPDVTEVDPVPAESEEDENKVVNNGEVSDPGNSGSFGTDGSVTGEADKPNG